MKKLFLFMVIALSLIGISGKAQTNDPFTVIKSQTVAVTTIFDTVSISTGIKTLQITNNTTGILSISFDNTYGNKDTVNVTTIGPSQEIILPERKSQRFYTKSTVAGNIKVVEYIGNGIGVEKYPAINSFGSLITSTESQSVLKFGSDTLTGSIDTLSFSTFTDWVQGSVTFDGAVDISTSAAFSTYTTLSSNVIFNLEKTSVASFPKLYIRRNAGSGTVNYSYTFGGK